MATHPAEPNRPPSATAPSPGASPALPPPASDGGSGGGSGGSDGAPAPTGRPHAPSPAVRRERRQRLVGWRSGDILRATVLVVGVYYGLRLLWQAQVLVLAAFLGILFGLAVDAGVDRLERMGLKRRGVSAALIVLTVIGLLVGFGAWTAPTMRRQSRELQTKLPEAVDKIEKWVESHRSGFLGLFLTDSGEPKPAQADVQPDSGSPGGGAAAPPDSTTAGAGPRPAAAGGKSADSTAAGERGGGRLRDRVFGQVSGARRYFFGFLSSTMSVFAGLLLVIFLAVYIAAEPTRYHDGLMHLFPHQSRKRAGEVLTAIALVLRKWLIAQLIAMLVIGTVTTIALLLLGVEAAFPLGLLVAVPLVAALQVMVKMLYVQDVVGDPVAVMNGDEDEDD